MCFAFIAAWILSHIESTGRWHAQTISRLMWAACHNAFSHSRINWLRRWWLKTVKSLLNLCQSTLICPGMQTRRQSMLICFGINLCWCASASVSIYVDMLRHPAGWWTRLVEKIGEDDDESMWICFGIRSIYVDMLRHPLNLCWYASAWSADVSRRCRWKSGKQQGGREEDGNLD